MSAITITRAELEQYRETRAKRLELDRQSKALEVEEKQFEEKVQSQLVKAKKTNTKRFGWVLSLVPQKNSVKWKDEFIRACGAAAASKLQEAAGDKEPKISITAPSDEAE